MSSALSTAHTTGHKPSWLAVGNGALVCGSCGNEVVGVGQLPCPVCRALCWQPPPWRPFTASPV
jgi:hypothetical protein